jgi:hypothetical protein
MLFNTKFFAYTTTKSMTYFAQDRNSYNYKIFIYEPTTNFKIPIYPKYATPIHYGLTPTFLDL